MAEGLTIEVRGADRLTRTSYAAAKDVEDLTSVHQSVASGIKQAARPPRLTGRLAASITTEASATEATVSSGLVYAPVIEFGWPRHGIEATHFLTNALNARYAEIVNDYYDHVDGALADVKGA